MGALSLRCAPFLDGMDEASERPLPEERTHHHCRQRRRQGSAARKESRSPPPNARWRRVAHQRSICRKFPSQPEPDWMFYTPGCVLGPSVDTYFRSHEAIGDWDGQYCSPKHGRSARRQALSLVKWHWNFLEILSVTVACLEFFFSFLFFRMLQIL